MPISTDSTNLAGGASMRTRANIIETTEASDVDDVETAAFSVIIPVYNEELAVSQTLSRLLEVISSLDVPHEVIVVNDGSTDGTERVLADWQDIRVVQHRVNRGYGASLKTGIRRAKYPWIVIMDADGTYPIEKIPELLELTKQADMVVGSRNGANITYPLIRKIPKWFLKRFAQWMVQEEIPDLNSGLRVFRKSVAERFLNVFPDGFSFTTTITLAMLSNGYIVHYEPIDYHARVGKSKIQPIRDTLRFVQLILRTGMYFAPLRVFLPIAAAFFLVFLVFLARDVFVLQNLNEATLILLVAATQLGAFALLADMLDKRSSR